MKEDRFTTWIKKELEYRKRKMHEANTLDEKIWFEAQVGILEIVVKELPAIGMEHKEITEEDIEAMAEEAYNKRTYGE